jgi:broad specificity phosphatase PhoE
MAMILLVRHGQASWGKLNYDALSPLGMQQAKLLGATLKARGFRPDVVITGAMKRHRQTATELMAGGEWASPTFVNPGWNEYDHQEIIRGYKPAYRNPVLLAADMIRSGRPTSAFSEMFAASIDQWVETEEGYEESFGQFRSRVTTALETTAALPNKNILVVTSAGPISWAATHLLGAGPTTWRKLNDTAVNTAVTKIVSGKRGLSVVSTNEHTHLERHRKLLTYR